MALIRYAPETPYPIYAFVPGQHPHPVTDSRGHSFGRLHDTPQPLDPRHPGSSSAFLHAIDLFNAGYYWEAHEVWEGLWVTAGRRGLVADFLKGLIKLAAAGVKSREGRAIGVQRHSLRAAELFESVRISQSSKQPIFCGLPLDELVLAARSLAGHPIVDTTTSAEGRVVIPYRLTLSDLDRL